MKKRKDRPKRPPVRPTPASVGGDGILLFLCLYGTVFSFTSAFSAQVHPLFLLGGCGVYTAVSLLTWSLPRRWWTLPLAVLAGLWGLGLWRLWRLLALGEAQGGGPRPGGSDSLGHPPGHRPV